MVNGLVSVVIPAYKPDFIEETLKSVFAQTYKNIEIIVVDDGSPYNLQNVLKSYIEEKSIVYIYQQNKKMGAAKNTGINHANGEYIAFIDDDDLWTKDKLEKQIPLFNNSKVGLVYSWAEEFENGITHSRNEYKNREIRGNIFNHIFLDNFIPNSSVVVRRSCLLNVGMFNETPDYYGIDDYDLWLRITHVYEADLIAEPLLKIRIHKKQVSGNSQFMIKQELNIKKKLAHNFNVSKRVFRKSYSHLLFQLGYMEKNLNKNKLHALKYFLYSSYYDFRLVHVKEVLKLFLPDRLGNILQSKLKLCQWVKYSPPE